MFEPAAATVPGSRVWQVGALCRAIADVLGARFNPVAVQGEVSGFSRATSGHCYFSLKDDSGQLRCAMFRRSASLLDFSPRDGELVEVRGRLDVYGPRGDLQLIVESMTRAGQGALFEQFLRLKAKLEAQGLFDPSRKRPLPALPRGIGVVTSLGAAALHDVMTALKRRVPHIPVVVAPALVQGNGAPAALIQSLSNLYRITHIGLGLEANLTGKSAEKGQNDLVFDPPRAEPVVVDVILLVRGGGSIDDLWAFNSEALALTIAQSPVPLISGVGHETDFTIADFVADLRAATPTAAAELVAQPRELWLNALDSAHTRLQDAVLRHVDTQAQRLDAAASRLGRPSRLAAAQALKLASVGQRLQFGVLQIVKHKNQQTRGLEANFPLSMRRGLVKKHDRLDQSALRLSLLDPTLVLQRGYAWLADAQGHTVTRAARTHAGQALRATLADGTVNVTVDGTVDGKPDATGGVTAF